MQRAEIWGRGITAGVLGGVAVLAWFLFIDLLVGWPFLTTGTLGSGLFLGARDIQAVEVSFTTVGGYAALHFLIFMAFGVAASRAVARAERRPRALLGA